MFDLIAEFEAIMSIPDDAKLYILRHLKEEHLSKNAFLLKAGQVCRHLYFVREGIVGSYFTHYGEDHAMRFTQKHEVCLVPESFLKQVPSKESMQAVVESVVYALSFDAIQRICRLWPRFHVVLNYYTLKQLAETTDRLYMLRSLDGLHRYRWIKDHFPMILGKVPVKKIASYIGLSDRSVYRLSRRDSPKPPLQ